MSPYTLSSVGAASEQPHPRPPSTPPQGPLLAAEARRAARPLIKSNNQCFSPTLSAITHRHRPRTPEGKGRAAEALRRYRERTKAARQAVVGWVGLGGGLMRVCLGGLAHSKKAI